MAARILAIDDSLTIRKLLENVLGRAGYALELAASGTEGLERARQNPPDLVLLDFVLPDMRGLDVCTAFLAEEALREIPVLVMSARGDSLRALFKDVGSVVGVLPKPFTPAEISYLVSDILARRRQPDAAPARVFTPAQKEAVARALYARLKDRFEHIPEWARSQGGGAAGPYFARKILTPDLMEGLLPALAPTFEEVLGRSAAPAYTPTDALLSGHTSLLPLQSLLTELAALDRTGVLVLEQSMRTTSLYLRRGDLVAVTHNCPEEFLRGGPDLGPTPVDELGEAIAEQRRSSLPACVSLARRGRLAPELLEEVLHGQGRRALVEAVGAGPGRFEWQETVRLPEWVERFGRPFSMDQMRLERLREVDDWTQVELQVPSLDAVFGRAESFSARVRQFELVENERRVLTVVNQRHTVQQIIDRTGLATFEVFHVLYRLVQIDLIRRKLPVVPGPAREVRPVMVLDRDPAIADALARLLRTRRHPLPVLPVGADADPLPALLAERPRLALLDTGAGLDLPGIATQVRATLEISDVVLAAVQEAEDPSAAEALREAGLDAVLVKPFLFSEVEKLLGA